MASFFSCTSYKYWYQPVICIIIITWFYNGRYYYKLSFPRMDYHSNQNLICYKVTVHCIKYILHVVQLYVISDNFLGNTAAYMYIICAYIYIIYMYLVVLIQQERSRTVKIQPTIFITLQSQPGNSTYNHTVVHVFH